MVGVPTMYLRFVEREHQETCAADGQLLPEGFVRTVRRRILQQQWVSLTSPESEWRDVPFDPGGA